MSDGGDLIPGFLRCSLAFNAPLGIQLCSSGRAKAYSAACPIAPTWWPSARLSYRVFMLEADLYRPGAPCESGMLSLGGGHSLYRGVVGQCQARYVGSTGPLYGRGAAAAEAICDAQGSHFL
ncbi:MAG: hypothetical protein GDA47_05640 [Rhodospirillales bacterium]|nr:hypothetical protein [Rhodospirillales bacterium]